MKEGTESEMKKQTRFEEGTHIIILSLPLCFSPDSEICSFQVYVRCALYVLGKLEISEKMTRARPEMIKNTEIFIKPMVFGVWVPKYRVVNKKVFHKSEGTSLTEYRHNMHSVCFISVETSEIQLVCDRRTDGRTAV